MKTLRLGPVSSRRVAAHFPTRLRKTLQPKKPANSNPGPGLILALVVPVASVRPSLYVDGQAYVVKASIELPCSPGLFSSRSPFSP